MELRQFLRLPLAKLEVSETFMAHAEKMGFETLEDILVCQPKELFERPGFSYLWLEEFIQLLNKHHILHLLQPKPGRNAY